MPNSGKRKQKRGGKEKSIRGDLKKHEEQTLHQNGVTLLETTNVDKGGSEIDGEQQQSKESMPNTGKKGKGKQAWKNLSEYQKYDETQKGHQQNGMASLSEIAKVGTAGPIEVVQQQKEQSMSNSEKRKEGGAWKGDGEYRKYDEAQQSLQQNSMALLENAKVDMVEPKIEVEQQQSKESVPNTGKKGKGKRAWKNLSEYQKYDETQKGQQQNGMASLSEIAKVGTAGPNEVVQQQKEQSMSNSVRREGDQKPHEAQQTLHRNNAWPCFQQKTKVEKAGPFNMEGIRQVLPQGNTSASVLQTTKDNKEQYKGIVQAPSSKPPTVTKSAETNLLHSTESKHSLGSKGFPKKPEPGTLGRKIQLVANHYPINIPSGHVYHYDVDIKILKRSSNVEGQAVQRKNCFLTVNRKVMDTVFKSYDEFHGLIPAFDGKKNLITKKPLPVVPLRASVSVADNGGLINAEVVIKEVGEDNGKSCIINLSEINELLDGKSKVIPIRAIMAIEIILRQGPAYRYLPLGRSFFQQLQNPYSLGGGCELWPGHHQSIRLGQWKPMVNINTTASAFYERQNLIRFVSDRLKTTPDRLQMKERLSPLEIKSLSKELVRLKVEVTHLKYPRKYTIRELSKEPTKSITFTIDEKQTIYVTDYFQQQYGIQLRFVNLPCLQVGSGKKKVYIPMEVCEIKEGQHCNKLSGKQTSLMIRQTAVPPVDRFRKINELRRELFENNPFLKEFELKISTRPLELPARMIDAPCALYSNDQKEIPKDGAWGMTNKKYFIGAVIESWVLISFHREGCEMRRLERLTDMIRDIGSQLGMSIKSCAHITYANNTGMRCILGDMKSKYKAQLIFAVMPPFNTLLYNELKSVAEIELGLVTQCCKADKLEKCNPQVVGNLCKKINAKMGGVNNCLYSENMPQMLKHNSGVIVIGADVNHPTSVDELKLSIAAVVASLDLDHCRYAATVSVQRNGEEPKKKIVEIIKDLDVMIKKMLLAYYKYTRGQKPQKILFYRDGVSEGQFDEVLNHEVTMVRKACSEMNKNSVYEPGLTFIIVQKRHHTRFMPKDVREGVGRGKNIPPGTTVDTVVTHPLHFDFYLCSHASPQGTSRPAHYTVAWDDNDFTADELQKLTYYLCHIYTGCTRSISIPVPVKYADMVAYRSRMHLISPNNRSVPFSADDNVPPVIMESVTVNSELANKMYFV